MEGAWGTDEQRGATVELFRTVCGTRKAGKRGPARNVQVWIERMLVHPHRADAREPASGRPWLRTRFPITTPTNRGGRRPNERGQTERPDGEFSDHKQRHTGEKPQHADAMAGL